jgi:periplasmic protein TonB
MLDVLIASGAHLELRPRWVTTSVLTHALLVTLAVMAGQAVLDAPSVTAPDPAILVFVPKPPPPPPAEVKPEAPPSAVVAEPPPKGFQTIAALTDIPKVIPPVDLSERPLDPRDFTGRGVEGGLAEGVVGGTGRVDTGPGGDLNGIYEATTNDERFEPAILVMQPAPRYPAALQAVGIEGQVMVEFVVDTLGRVQPRSIRIMATTHPDFAAAARAAVAGASFRPAHLSAHPVRQLTRQSIRFVTTR